MHFHYPFTQAARSGMGLGAMLVVLLAGCGGGGSSASTSTPTPTISPYQMGGAIQRAPLNLAPNVSTLAGALQNSDGTGVLARFKRPKGIVSDGTNLYVADTYNNMIRKVVIATGVVTTLAGTGALGSMNGAGSSATFNYPSGITIDGGSLYVTDTANNMIRKIVIASGEVSTLAGTGYGAEDGAGASAKFYAPFGITTDGTNLYVADRDNNKIRKIVIATGMVSSLTGVANTAGATGSANGAGTSATFTQPYGITTDGVNLYVTDTNNSKIRKIVIASGEVSTLAGSGLYGATDGAPLAATFSTPESITTDGSSLYVADTWGNKIRKVDIATGTVSTLAGTNVSGSADGAGVAAKFNLPSGITVTGGNLYVADTDNNTIRSVVLSDAVVTSLAGRAFDADGASAAASFNSPTGIATDGTNLYVADKDNCKIRKIEIATGVVSTLAGTGERGSLDGSGVSATFRFPSGITTDGSNLYVSDTTNNKIRKIVIATGVVSTLAGTGLLGATDGAGLSATFQYPQGITTDGNSLYVADTGSNKIRKIDIVTGEVATLAGAGASGVEDGAGTSATFRNPHGITTDGANLYVADTFNSKIRKIVIATGQVSSLTGVTNTWSAGGAADGAGLLADFYLPYGITSDGVYLYVTDTYNNKIRKIEIATGEVSSLTASFIAGAADGAGTTATFNHPESITTDGSSLYVTDTTSGTIRKIQ